jgi:hypothetical protein
MSLFECYFLFCFSNLEIYLVSDHFITIAIILLNQGPTNCCFNPVGGGSACATISNPAASSVLPSLQCILQQNTLQRVWFFYIPPHCFFIYLLFEKILVLLIVDRRKFLNWSSTWNKPLVMNHLLKSFLLLLIRPAHYNYLDLIICRQAGGIWWGSH